jgi:hypothetical protein
MHGQTQIKFTDNQRSEDLHVHIRGLSRKFPNISRKNFPVLPWSYSALSPSKYSPLLCMHRCQHFFNVIKHSWEAVLGMLCKCKYCTYCKNHTCVSLLIAFCVVMRGEPQQAIMRYAALVGEQKSPAAWRMVSHWWTEGESTQYHAEENSLCAVEMTGS